MNIGIVSLQGNFIQHQKVLEGHCRASLNIVLIKNKATLTQYKYDGFIIPGGESSTMLHLLDKQDMRALLYSLIKAATIPTLATCAGLIIVSSTIIDDKQGTLSPPKHTLGIVDISIERNAYGRQVDSFIATLPFTPPPHQCKGNPIPNTITGLFIRAPKIVSMPESAEVLAVYKNDPVIIKDGNVLLSTFHPEALYDGTLHAYFIETMVMKHNQ